MDGVPVPIPGETRPEPEDKKNQNSLIWLSKLALLLRTWNLEHHSDPCDSLVSSAHRALEHS